MLSRPTAIAAATCLLLACKQTPLEEPDAARVEAAPTVAWVHAVPLAGDSTFEAMGQLIAPTQGRAAVALPLMASVIELRVDRGQQVAAGEVLAVVMIPEAVRAAAQVEGERLRQGATRERLQQLEGLRAEGLARAGDIAELKARLRESEAAVLEAQAVLGTIEAIGIRKRGRTYEIAAPIAGVVVELRAARGSVHGPSDGPLLVVAGGAATRVEARFAFTPPTGLQYRLLAPDGVSAALTLRAKAPQLSAADATQLCWFDLGGPIALTPGTLVRVQIVPEPDLWIVSRGALAPALQLTDGRSISATVLATLGEQALVRAQLPADARLRAGAQVAEP